MNTGIEKPGLDGVSIRRETEADFREVENLVREAFWNVYRPGCLEHYLLHCFRRRPEFVPELDLVMEKGGRIIGQVMYARSEIATDGGGALPVMTFGPIGILPEFQRQGLGLFLLKDSMRRAAAMGAGALAIEGNIGFYGKAGFSVGSAMGIHYYAEPRENEVPYFLVAELVPGYLNGVTGTYRDPEGYNVAKEKAEEFDKGFPKKEKLVLPGQLP